jgi:type IV secretion system protein VirB5
MKRIVKLFIVGLMFMASSIYATGIPVVDGMANGLSVEQIAEQISEYEEIIRQWETEIENWGEEFESMTGTRELGNLISNITKEIEWLEEQYSDIQSLIDDPSAALSGEAANLLEKFQIHDNCAGIKDEAMKKICYYEFRSRITELSGYNTVSEDLTKTMSKIETLNDKIKNSSDQKQSLDNIAAATKLVAELEAKRQMEELSQTKAAKQREVNDIAQKQKMSKALSTPIPNFTIEYRPIGKAIYSFAYCIENLTQKMKNSRCFSNQQV